MVWKPPLSGLKLNFDGSSIKNPGPRGYGEVIRDHLGSMIRIIARPLGVCNSTKAEVMGLLMRLRKFKNLGLVNGMV